jgi:hypothetical protein
MRTHHLKCWPEIYDAVYDRKKTAEFRKEDRKERFSVGDDLRLVEWDPKTEKHTGRSIFVKITHIVRGPEFGVPYGYVVMSIKR